MRRHLWHTNPPSTSPAIRRPVLRHQISPCAFLMARKFNCAWVGSKNIQGEGSASMRHPLYAIRCTHNSRNGFFRVYRPRQPTGIAAGGLHP